MKLKRVVRAAAIFCLGLLLVPWETVSGGRRQDVHRVRHATPKMATLLAREVAFLASNPDYDYSIPVIIQVDPALSIEEGRDRGRKAGSVRYLKSVRGYAASLTGREIKALVASPLVRYVTLDSPVRVLGSGHGDGSGGFQTAPTYLSKKGDRPSHSSTSLRTIGADQVAATGRGITVAVFDSGIGDHKDLAKRRVRAAIDFTEGYPEITSRGRDQFGHGTHVSGIIGGSGAKSKGEFAGVAPGVSFVDVRVVDSSGCGQTSNLIQAIEWVTRMKEALGIRVANLSLGHPPIESYLRDPLCQAVSQMVRAGIVTLASAGNLGKTSVYPEIWGAIASPGIDPSVITVYPVNTRGTLTHRDDVATSYGSRGPSIDGIFKPDLSAPGNQITSTLAAGSYLEEIFADRVSENHEYVDLSGASMATAFVTGTVALMLEENPRLKPNLVKLILLFSAIKLENPALLEQGNGLVNTKTAVELAGALDFENRRLRNEVAPFWQLEGEDVSVGGAFAYGDQVVYGPAIQERFGETWGDGVTWTDSVFWTDRKRCWTDGVFSPDGVFWTESVLWTDQDRIWADGLDWVDESVQVDSVLWTDRQRVGVDSVFWTDRLFVPTSVFWTDSVLWTDRTALSGDPG